MPLRADLRSVLVIGSGPIVIGQAAEFDYSGTQACRALRRLGLRVVLVNSNPATIMTDPEVADATYLEPLTPDSVAAVLEVERPDALLPTLGGQTALNLAVALHERGDLDRLGVELIGATVEAVRRAESRVAFKQVCRGAGLDTPNSVEVGSLEEGRAAVAELGLPVVLRPSFTLGGWGGGIARDAAGFEELLAQGLAASPVHRVLVEESVLGWKEFELEVMRDRADNAVVVCSIENLDPMGVHTGDSITVAPAMTLSDREYQAMRDDALTVLRAVGVETGGANVQFAVDPASGRRVVIEMNPRVSRSSALASKATGFPIAKVAAQLAVGFTLDEIRNEVTGKTAAAFEPTLDYVAVKVPRFNFEKFPDADPTLTTRMKSVGEVMALGRTFPEALQKAFRSLETGRDGLGTTTPVLSSTAGSAASPARLGPTAASPATAAVTGIPAAATAASAASSATAAVTAAATAASTTTTATEASAATAATAARAAPPVGGDVHPGVGGRNRLSTGEPGSGAEGGQAGGDFAASERDREALLAATAIPREDRLEAVERALRAGCTVDEVAAASSIDPWFLDQIARIVEARAEIEAAGAIDALDRELLWRAKRLGFSDRQLAALVGATEGEVRTRRRALGVEPVYRAVDTCAGEFEASTPYYYSTYEEETEVPATGRRRVVVLGSGPNRIGQGVEFDTACVHAVQALREAGYETVMVNCNPETVSTDYDVADRLYLEPLTTEDVLEVCRAEARGGQLVGVIVTMGGQTPLQLAHGLAAAGVPLLGTPPEAIDLAEDRGRFGRVLAELGLDAPAWGQAKSREEALEVAGRIGFPVLARPSYVLGGRSMEVFYDPGTLARSAALASLSVDHGARPVLIDRFLEDAVEVDVDALCDAAGDVLVCGVMEHIEEAGVHSGDSACVLPPITLGPDQVAEVAAATAKLGRALGVVGILNVQFAFKGERLYVLEANPRASRSVPFVEKVTGLPVGKAAALLAAGARLADLRRPGGMLPPGEGILAPEPPHVGVKEAVLPFARFPGADSLLGPEMRSTGEVLGLDYTFGAAFAKSQEASYGALPTKGVAFLSVRNADKRAIVLPAKRLADLGFTLVATAGTASVLNRNGVPARVVRKVGEGPGNVVELIRAGEIDVVVNTPQGSGPRADGYEIRTAAVAADIPCVTTLSGLAAMVQGIEARLAGELTVQSLQDYHQRGPEREQPDA